MLGFGAAGLFPVRSSHLQASFKDFIRKKEIMCQCFNHLISVGMIKAKHSWINTYANEPLPHKALSGASLKEFHGE